MDLKRFLLIDRCQYFLDTGIYSLTIHVMTKVKLHQKNL
jgi:hypothetical protein